MNTGSIVVAIIIVSVLCGVCWCFIGCYDCSQPDLNNRGTNNQITITMSSPV